MASNKKMLIKSIYALALTILVSVTAVFAWFRLIFPASGAFEIGVIDSDNVSMEISISNNQGEPGGGLRLYSMVPEDEYNMSIKFINSANFAVTFDLEFINVAASLFNFNDDYGQPIISNLSLLNVFAVSYATENVVDGYGNIVRTYYSLAHLYYATNGVVYSAANSGLNINLLDNEPIPANSTRTIAMTIKFLSLVYDHTNSTIAAPINLFQGNSMNIESLSIIEN